MKKPHKYTIVNGLYFGFDRLGNPIGYIRPIDSVARPPTSPIERFDRVGR